MAVGYGVWAMGYGVCDLVIEHLSLSTVAYQQYHTLCSDGFLSADWT